MAKKLKFNFENLRRYQLRIMLISFWYRTQLTVKFFFGDFDQILCDDRVYNLNEHPKSL